jgi:putative addiction module component (TIGR02574 family)
MSRMPAVSLEKSVLSLPRRRRAALAARLMESLSRPPEGKHDAAWRTEIEARIDAFDDGRLPAKPLGEVLRYRGKGKP